MGVGMPEDPRAGQALNLCLAGIDWRTIARKLHYDDPADAAQAAMAAAEEQYDGPRVDASRMLEILRLDRLQSAVWKNAMQGDAEAVRQALEISDRRARLMRLSQRTEP